MEALTLYLHGQTALNYDCLGAASIKMKCSRRMLQNHEKCTSWLERKSNTWKTEGRGIAKQ